MIIIHHNYLPFVELSQRCQVGTPVILYMKWPDYCTQIIVHEKNGLLYNFFGHWWNIVYEIFCAGLLYMPVRGLLYMLRKPI